MSYALQFLQEHTEGGAHDARAYQCDIHFFLSVHMFQRLFSLPLLVVLNVLKRFNSPA